MRNSNINLKFEVDIGEISKIAKEKKREAWDRRKQNTCHQDFICVKVTSNKVIQGMACE